jgi:hypothetical protein
MQAGAALGARDAVIDDGRGPSADDAERVGASVLIACRLPSAAPVEGSLAGESWTYLAHLMSRWAYGHAECSQPVRRCRPASCPTYRGGGGNGLGPEPSPRGTPCTSSTFPPENLSRPRRPCNRDAGPGKPRRLLAVSGQRFAGHAAPPVFATWTGMGIGPPGPATRRCGSPSWSRSESTVSSFPGTGSASRRRSPRRGT